jgi:hypothetical protein
MNSVAVDIKAMLQADGDVEVDSSVGCYDIFIGKEPDNPENSITIFETGGYPPQLNFNKDEIYEYPSVQIRVRSTDYLDCWSLANSIKDSLHGRAHETWNGTYYSVIYCLNGPTLLDFDQNNNPRFILNFNVQRR